ncbi:hypothetical protein J3Q64DRAFT_1723832 [Phycomyces blakesleeanus]|uniref:Uncharacterized protein n=2 Tax=Phycomyces blakesleeanus TaxID=4837 RepID=A0A162YFP0_PHYB8|nr:hypothetical protein PHYBLDRAFT_161012 [Phycomyces blakesleeanus NRRL 1555(-)]OAD80365.1 hypothetical protein PHYBLDRAFT_161012 [Phycomyces blakesleeanus NRRL 1555(-)]|eukprot:XP_018298405.1 hypothetical protein PHYBLDRAFT_161012 [Phycomyces blakesleeanus NRRL 1555(-)]
MLRTTLLKNIHLLTKSSIGTATATATATTTTTITLCKYSQARVLAIGGCQRQLSTQSKDTRPSEYELRVGYAIAILQDDLPNFFENGLENDTIYSNNIVLSDPHYTRLSIQGRTTYLHIAQALRWSLRMYFDAIQFEITRMRVLPDIPADSSPDDTNNRDDQSQEEDSGENQGWDPQNKDDMPDIHPLRDVLATKGVVRSLEVRWRLQGTHRPSFGLNQLLGMNVDIPVRHVEGVFVYAFDSEGFIGEHRIQRIVPPPSRRVLWVHSWGARLHAYLEALRRRPELNPGIGVGCRTTTPPP